ncbi:pseudouridine synthase [Tardiphaga sp. 862_B3_N1_1]|uniref:pseudouridine synthase n=1 Tax=Tardiphaga sp. 862_B3_N1_1 TaxID=3240763 RepID=UPI003F8C6EDA
MPRDNDKNNGPSRGRPPGGKGGAGKGRSGAARGPDKKFAKRDGTYTPKPPGAGGGEKRSFGGKPSGGKSFGAKPFGSKPYAGKRDDDRAPRRDYGDAPRRDRDDARPARFNRDDRPARSGGGDRPDRGPRKDFGDREKRPYSPRVGGGDKRPYSPRGDAPRGERPNFNRDDRAPRGDRGDARPAGRFSDKKFGERKPYAPRDGGGEKRPYTPRGEGFRGGDGDRPRPRFDRPQGDRNERPQRDRSDRPQGDRPFSPRPSRDGDRPRGDRPFSAEKKFGGDKKFPRGAPDRGGPRKSFGDRNDRPDRGDRGGRDFERGPDRSEQKPWQKREGGADDRGSRSARPPRDGARNFDRPKFDRPKFERPREDRPERGDSERPRFSRPREDRPSFDRSREPRGRTDWQEHGRSEARDGDERPRRENEDDSRIFAKRPAFGGRGEYRERDPEARRPARVPAAKKAGERIAKVVSRAGLCSRRDAEEWVTQGRVAVNGRVINSPALDVSTNDVITVDGKPLPAPERTRLFLYHKPRGLMTTHADPEGRPTVFDHLPEGLPRLISIGRLDFNTEGLLLLTNDGGLARTLELPETGWLRRYRVRAHGEVTQAQLNELKNGVEVDGVKYGSIDATLERDKSANVWIVFAIREGKNREVRNVLAHLGLEVNRLIRISYGPFQLGEIEEGQVDEVKTRVLREQLGEKIADASGADFGRQMPSKGDVSLDPVIVKKPVLKRSTVEDRKGRRILVQRAGSEESRARNEDAATFGGPPKKPKRGYHGKRDLKPRDA